jgi:hypothetical protein
MPRYFHRSLRHVSLALFVFSVGLSHGQAALAAIFNVDRTDDEATADDCDPEVANDCSLRGAILAANALAEASTINVPAGTFVLSQSSTCTYRVKTSTPGIFTSSQIPLCLSKNITIQGAGATATIIDGDRRGRVLFVSADAVAEVRGGDAQERHWRSNLFLLQWRRRHPEPGHAHADGDRGERQYAPAFYEPWRRH